MPLFKSQRPRGIGQSVRAMLSSSPRLSGVEQAQAEHLGAQTGHQQALSEQIRLKLEQEREAAQARSDPNLRTEYAGTVAGLDSPTARRFEKFRTGAVEPQIAPMDEEGNPMPPAVYARPENVTPEQERSYRSALASTMANMLATGETNAEQLAHAGGRLSSQKMLDDASRSGIPVPEQNTLIAAATGKIREPFEVTAGGALLNKETRELDETPLAAVAARQAVEALTGQRGAAAALSTTRAGDITATQPSRIDLNTARATAAREGRPGAGNQYRDLDKARAQYDLTYPKSMAGMRINNNAPGKRVPDFNAYYKNEWPVVRQIAGVEGGAPAAARLAPQGAFKAPDDVKAAFLAGKLTEEQASQVLRDEFGFE